MNFLRTLFLIAVTVVVVVFSLRNWVPVTLNLFGDLQADVKLPVLLLASFLLGFLPMYVWHRLTRWRRRPAAEPAPVPTPTAEPAPPPPVGLPLPLGAAPPRAD